MNGERKYSSARTLASLSLLTAMLLSVSSCSLGSMPSKSSQIGSIETDSSDMTGSDTTFPYYSYESSEEDNPEDRSITDTLKVLAEEYMKVLVLGDPAVTAQTFNLKDTDVLPPTYDYDQQIYQTVFTNLTYHYGPMITSDYIDCNLDVTCIVPDLRGCIEELLSDDAYMAVAARTWVASLVSVGDTEETETVRKQMWDDLVSEAMRRINDGEYTGTLMFTECFSFHDNGGGDWLCTGTPDFVKLMSQDGYMVRLTYIDMIAEYYIIENAGTQMVTDGELEQQKLDDLLERKRQAIIDAQEG